MEQLAPGIRCVAVRTPTLPPATHTNTWIVGDGALTVVDPASPWEDEQQRLAGGLRERMQQGEHVERIVLTHHHADHVGGAEALQAALSTPQRRVPIVAHAATADRLAGRVVVDGLLEDDQVLDCGGRSLFVRHTPGHAPGHVVLHDPDSGAVVAGDLVAGVGTILIEPDDGDLGQYLDSLARVASWRPQVLLPAHGPALEHARVVLDFYIAHRHQRTDQIRRALEHDGQATPLQLAATVYAELPTALHRLAARQIVSHLRWMSRHGLARPIDGEARWSRA